MKITNLTNLEISKKLKEIGFKADTLFYWTKVVKFKKTDPDIDCITIICENEKWRLYKTDVPAYDLETLIDALPDSFTREYKSNKDGTIKEFEENLVIEKNKIWYKCYDIETSDEANEFWREYEYQQNISIYHYYDSLTNLAGKMLIKLFEAGLIKFNK